MPVRSACVIGLGVIKFGAACLGGLGVMNAKSGCFLPGLGVDVFGSHFRGSCGKTELGSGPSGW